MENKDILKLKALLENPKIENVLILPHLSPDGDAIGSAIGLKHLIELFNKRGYIISNDDIPSNLSFLLTNEDRIYSEQEIQNLDYQLIIFNDVGEKKLILDREKLLKQGVQTLCIDHHLTNTGYADLNLIDPKFSSTGEMVYYLYEVLSKTINSKAAEALYTAIITDTGSLRYSNTRAYTFQACQKLVEIGFDFERLNIELFQKNPIEKVLLLNKIMNGLEIFNKGKIGFVSMTKELKIELGYNSFDSEGVVETVRDIDGIEVVAFIKHEIDNWHKVSLRSKQTIDVSQIALHFGGGGHARAAGFKVDMPYNELYQLLKVKITEAI